MKCSKCGREPAGFHMTEASPAGAREVHLCVGCAKSEGWREARPHEPCAQTPSLEFAAARAIRKMLRDGPRGCP